MNSLGTCGMILIVGLTGLGQVACNAESVAAPVCSLTTLDNRRDLEVGDFLPAEFRSVRTDYILLLHDCGGCGTDVQLLKAAERDLGRSAVAVFFPQSVIPKYSTKGWCAFRSYSAGPDYRPMLLKISQGRVEDLERRSQYFWRLK